MTTTKNNNEQDISLLEKIQTTATRKKSLNPGLIGVPLPNIIHEAIEENMNDNQRIIIVGDIHGCYNELQSLLKKCSYNSDQDKLILVGDLMSKGPSPIKVLKFAQSHENIYSIRGNHDDAALKAYYTLLHECDNEDDAKKHELYQKYSYALQFTPKDINYLEQLPFTISIPAYNSIVVHAGLVPNIDLDEQQPFDMYKMRNILNDGKATSSDKEGVPWASLWEGPMHVYFGHDAKRKIQRYEYATGLDSGCCYGNSLTAVILPSKEMLSVNAEEVYQEVTGN